MTEKTSSATLDPQDRRRAERLLAPVRLDDPYPAIPIEDYAPALESLVLQGMPL